MTKQNTAPLFEPPETEIETLPAPFHRRVIASIIDLGVISFFFLMPLSIVKSTSMPRFILGVLIYLMLMVFSYFFSCYFLMGKTLGDAFLGIKLCPPSLGFKGALFFSLIKTLFTVVPLNLLLVFLLEDRLTGEQFLFDLSYCLN